MRLRFNRFNQRTFEGLLIRFYIRQIEVGKHIGKERENLSRAMCGKRKRDVVAAKPLPYRD